MVQGKGEETTQNKTEKSGAVREDASYALRITMQSRVRPTRATVRGFSLLLLGRNTENGD